MTYNFFLNFTRKIPSSLFNRRKNPKLISEDMERDIFISAKLEFMVLLKVVLFNKPPILDKMLLFVLF